MSDSDSDKDSSSQPQSLAAGHAHTCAITSEGQPLVGSRSGPQPLDSSYIELRKHRQRRTSCTICPLMHRVQELREHRHFSAHVLAPLPERPARMIKTSPNIHALHDSNIIQPFGWDTQVETHGGQHRRVSLPRGDKLRAQLHHCYQTHWF